MLAEIRIQLGDPKARYFLVPSFCVLLQQQYKLLPLHVIQCDIDVLRLPAHYLGGMMVYLVSHPSSGDPHHRGETELLGVAGEGVEDLLLVGGEIDF